MKYIFKCFDQRNFLLILLFAFETRSPHVVQAGIKLRILLSQPDKYWDSIHLAFLSSF